ncbi:MAG: hypothetical protein M3O32_03845 [Actinomycetota bacterium]|nr:hypothetical protein [Actinomycetota bacterium]
MRTAALAGAASAVVLSASAPAMAYPRPAGAVSGTCTPTGQTVSVGATAASLSCTFNLQDYNGAANSASYTGTITTSGYSAGTTPVSGSGSTIAFTVPAAACSAVGTLSETVTVAVNGGAINSSGQSFSTVTCAKPTARVTAVSCTSPTSSPMFTGYQQSNCSWTTSAADGTSVSYSVAGANAFQFGGSSQVSGGGFGTTVYFPSSDAEGTVKITGFVSGTASLDGNSATQNSLN